MSLSKDFEFRSISKEERADFDSVVRYVFANTSTEPDPDEDTLNNEWTTAALHKGKVVATSAGYPFKMRLNGQAVFADGLTAVGTEPGYRRRGLVRELVTRRLHMVHEHEHQSVSILWASMAAIYQRFGYGLGSTHTSCAMDPRYVMFQFEQESGGYVRNLDERDGMPIIRDLYRKFIEDRTLALHRVDEMWLGSFGTKKTKAFCAVYYDDDDVPQGYVTYRLEILNRRDDDPGPDQKIVVRDYVYRSIQAYRALWEFLRAHDLAGKIQIDLPKDDPAFDMLLEPAMLNLTSWDGIWLRIVDAARVLKTRNYGARATFVIEVQNDAECPWNERKFLVDTDGNHAEVNSTALSSDIKVNPNGLASLLTGNTSMSQLCRIGRATVDDPAKLPTLDAVFKTTHAPFCYNGF